MSDGGFLRDAAPVAALGTRLSIGRDGESLPVAEGFDAIRRALDDRGAPVRSIWHGQDPPRAGAVR
jgi:hypothetical protein